MGSSIDDKFEEGIRLEFDSAIEECGFTLAFLQRIYGESVVHEARDYALARFSGMRSAWRSSVAGNEEFVDRMLREYPHMPDRYAAVDQKAA